MLRKGRSPYFALFWRTWGRDHSYFWKQLLHSTKPNTQFGEKRRNDLLDKSNQGTWWMFPLSSDYSRFNFVTYMHTVEEPLRNKQGKWLMNRCWKRLFPSMCHKSGAKCSAKLRGAGQWGGERANNTHECPRFRNILLVHRESLVLECWSFLSLNNFPHLLADFCTTEHVKGTADKNLQLRQQDPFSKGFH